MINRKVIFRVCLLVLTGISCNLISTLNPSPTPTLNAQRTLYDLADALTIANQTIQAENQNFTVTIPATNTVTFHTQTQLPLSTKTNYQFPILGEHHVILGETLSCIGRGYRVLPKAIAEANGIDLLYELKTNQILLIPKVQWVNITDGPICPPQFTPPNWGSEPTKPPRATKQNYDAPNIPTATPPSIDPPVIITLPPICLPPFCIRPTVWQLPSPTDTHDPGATEPPIVP